MKGGSARLTARVSEACRLAGIGRSKLYMLMKEGRIEAIKVSSMTLIPMRSLEAFLGLEELTLAPARSAACAAGRGEARLSGR